MKPEQTTGAFGIAEGSFLFSRMGRCVSIIFYTAHRLSGDHLRP